MNIHLIYWQRACLMVLFFTFVFTYGQAALSDTVLVKRPDSLDKKVLLKKAGKFNDQKAQLDFAISKFKKFNGSTDEYQVAAFINLFKEIGRGNEPVISIISIKLKENDPLYHNRGPKEVERLRGYMLASLSEIGINEQLIPILKAELTYGHRPFMVAAAARSAGNILSSNQASFVLLLTRYLDVNYKDDEVDLDNYGNVWPLKKPTSARLEVIKTLGKIGAGTNVVLAQTVLREIAEAKKGSFFARDTVLILNARLALDKLNLSSQDHSMHQMSMGLTDEDEDPDSCCGEPASKTTSIIWINPDKRAREHLKNWKAIDQNGNNFQLSSAFGKPFILTFFYTRCDNPKKCSATISNLATLREDLQKQGFAAEVSIFAITFEPEFDSPPLIKAYGTDRGANFDEHFKFLKMDDESHQKLIKELSVLVNYGKGLVNTHGNQLFVFDKQGRLAKLYENTVWKNETVIKDFKVLLNEK